MTARRLTTTVPSVAARVAAANWEHIVGELDARGAATTGPLLDPAECRALAQATARLARCAGVPPDLASIISQEASALVGAAQQASKAELPYVEGQCRHVRDQIAQTVQQSGCPLM